MGISVSVSSGEDQIAAIYVSKNLVYFLEIRPVWLNVEDQEEAQKYQKVAQNAAQWVLVSSHSQKSLRLSILIKALIFLGLKN